MVSGLELTVLERGSDFVVVIGCVEVEVLEAATCAAEGRSVEVKYLKVLCELKHRSETWLSCTRVSLCLCT